jgi:hypothetical protein
VISAFADQIDTTDRVRKMRWIAMGLFAPELVVYNARMQRRRVDQVTRQARESQQLAKELGMPQAFEWTQYHSWYMVMGGFYFKTSDSSGGDSFPLKMDNDTDTYDFIPDSPDLILTADSMDMLTSTSPPLLPSIDAALIKDHSKADVVAKALAILQALYQLMSIISRLALKLPISQLEINTLGHVLCAFAMLILWLKKPKDIKVRTQIRDDWAKPLCAYLWMCSARSAPAYTEDSENSAEIYQLFPILRTPNSKIIATTVPEELSQTAGADTIDSTMHTRKQYCEKGVHENLKIDHIISRENSITLTDSMMSELQIPVRLGSVVLCNNCSPSPSIATLYEPRRLAAAVLPPRTLEKRGSVREYLKGQPAGWFSWKMPRIDPVNDPGTFEDVVRPTLRERFQHAEIQYDNTTTANRVCAAMSYFRFYSLFVTSRPRNDPEDPKKVALGVKHFRKSSRPPLLEVDPLVDHISDWFIECQSGVWYSTSIVPALLMALLTTCYGAIHTFLWHSHFPTQVSVDLTSSKFLFRSQTLFRGLPLPQLSSSFFTKFL